MGFFQVLARAGDKSSAKAPEKRAELALGLLARDIVFNAPSPPPPRPIVLLGKWAGM